MTYFESRCKICSSKYRQLYEKLRNDGWELEQIKQYAETQLGESFSIMSLSRHLHRHTKEIEIPEIELPTEPILTDDEIFKLTMYVLFGLDLSVEEVSKFREEWNKLDTPTLLTKSSYYKCFKEAIKNSVPKYLDKFESKWKQYLDNPEIIYQPLA